MYVKEDISFYDFENRFRQAGRSDNFSQRGLELLFDYLDNNVFCDPADCWDGDVVALCCEYSEYNKEDATKELGDDWENDIAISDEEDDVYIIIN